jgi:hypothetical protein
MIESTTRLSRGARLRRKSVAWIYVVFAVACAAVVAVSFAMRFVH